MHDNDTIDRAVLIIGLLSGSIAAVLQGATAVTIALLVIFTYQYAQDRTRTHANPRGYTKIRP